MPFDGAKRTGFVSLEDMLLDMVEFALDGGNKWSQCLIEWGEHHCLFGAVEFVRRETNFGPDRVEELLVEAIRNWRGRRGRRPSYRNREPEEVIADFNDALKRRFSEVVEVIREARELAQIDAYVKEMERKTGRSANADPATRRLAAELSGLFGATVNRAGVDPGAVSASRAKAPAPA